MNILMEKMPESVVVDGKVYPLNTGFKNWIKAGHIASQQSGKREDILKALLLCYKKRLPPSLSAACRGIFEFYGGAFKNGGDPKCEKDGAEASVKKKIVDFYYDSPYIYCDFLSFYGIDLMRENMHFYKFCTLFEGLGDDCKTVQIMKIRALDIANIKSGDLKQKYVKLKKVYSLSKYMPEHVKRREFGEALGMFF